MNVSFLQVNVRRSAPRDPTVVQGQLLEAADAKNRDQARWSVMHIDVLVSGQGFHDPCLDSIASFSLKAQCGYLFNIFQPQTTNEVIRCYAYALCRYYVNLGLSSV